MDFNNAFKVANTDSKPPAGMDAFDSTAPAPEYALLPPGTYAARVRLGEYCSTKTGAEAYRIRFVVTEGEHAGKTITRTWTFGPKALPYTRRELAAFGLTTKAQLLSPFPRSGAEYLVRLVVALQQSGDGREFNDIKRIDVLSDTDAQAAAFGLTDEPEGGPKA